MHTPSLRGASAALALAVVASGIAALPALATPLQADRTGPQLLGEPTRGERAVSALGDRLDRAARVNDMTSSRLRSLLRTDRTVWLDSSGRMFYLDPAPSTGRAAAPVPAAAYPLDQTFSLHSLPGSERTIFLDFDGEMVSGTAWNSSQGVPNGQHPAWTLDADPATFSDTERAAIQSIFQRVAEDYAPFGVDVTTQDPGAAAITRSGAADRVYGTRALISPSISAAQAICGSGCGGAAYTNVFDNFIDHAYAQPAWIFPHLLNDDIKGIAEATTHEVGHNFGLEHDGNNVATYDGGHGSWAPIMGVGYNRPIVQWSKGDYANANNQQDDLAVIAANGAPVRLDEAGSTIGTAAQLPTGTAFIASRADTDVYALGPCAAGSLTLDATTATPSPNLDLELTLLDAAGATIETNNPPSTKVDRDIADGMSAAIDRTVPSGSYYAVVDGVGNGTPAAGYDDYGSLGAYTLTAQCASTGGVPAATAPSAPRIKSARSGARGGKVTAKARWAASPSDGDSPLQGYQVHAFQTRQGTVVRERWSRQLSASARAFTMRLPRGRWRFQVGALNDVGWSDPSARSNLVRAR